jgi:hypothetical protein
MARHKAVSEWMRRNRALITDQALVMAAIDDPDRCRELMSRYRKSSWGYIDWFLLIHKIVVDADGRKAATRGIWEGVLATMPERLATRWSQGNVGFRVLLCEAIHESYFGWQKMGAYKPSIDGLASPIPGDEAELLRWQRFEILEKARERLRLDGEKTRTKRYQSFLAWEADKNASHHTLNVAMARMAGCRPLDPQDFRQTLSRARDRFGRYLAEEVGRLFAEKDGLDVDKFRDAFEKLDLMEDYALKSKHCRELLDLADDE